MRIWKSGVVLLAAGLAQAAPAQFAVTTLPSIIGNAVAQGVAANAEAACMNGTKPADKEIIEARDPAIIVMQQYFDAAKAGRAKSGSFHIDKHTKWIAGSATATGPAVDAAADPLAAAGRSLASKPLRFYRSGMDAAALGQWVVTETDGRSAGVYTGLFVRRKQGWRLRSLTVSQRGERVEPAMQFCHAPGDVAKYRMSNGAALRDYRERRLAKARIKLADAERKGNGSAANAALIDRWMKEVAERETALAAAVTAEREAKEHAQKIERMTVDAGDATALGQET